MSASLGSGKAVVLTVSDNALCGNSACEIFTLKGALLRLIPFVSRGVGTYTLFWDGTDARGGRVPAATYLCRISIGSDVIYKRFITR